MYLIQKKEKVTDSNAKFAKIQVQSYILENILSFYTKRTRIILRQ